MTVKDAALLGCLVALVYLGWCGDRGVDPTRERVEALEAAARSLRLEKDEAVGRAEKAEEDLVAAEVAADLARQRADSVGRESHASVAAATRRILATMPDSSEWRARVELELEVIKVAHREELAAKDSALAASDGALAAARVEIADLRAAIWLDAEADSVQLEINRTLQARIRELEKPDWSDRLVSGLIGFGVGVIVHAP